MKKLNGNAPCPCGSGEKYKKCCWEKDFRYIVNEKGEIFQEIKLQDKMGQEILKKQKKNFEKLFGRQIEEDDPLFADVLLMSPETYNEGVTTILEEIGVQPQIIYAATKLGFAVVKGWENRYTTQQLKEWREAIQEYDDLKKGKKKIDIPPLVIHIQEITSTFDTLKHTYALIIQKYNILHQDRTSIDINQPADYCFFILTRTLKTMGAIELLIENHLGEDSLNLIRSVYENYLQILMAIHAPEQLKQEIQARIGLLNKTYTRKKNSLTTLIEIATQKEIKLWTGARRTTLNPKTKEDDLLIYQDLYNMLSSFTHPDVSSWNAYVDGNGFSLWEKNFTPVAQLYFCYINLLIFSELFESDLIPEKMKKDLRSYVKRVLPVIQKVFEELCQSDENIPKAFLNRLKSMKKSL